MNLGKIIGTVWATRKVESLERKRMLFVQPMAFCGTDVGDPIVALDTVDSGVGDTIIYVSSTEATVPFKPLLIPTDATIVGVIDRVDHRDKSWTPERA
ncbi:MAG: EutN/CcmL family microcompartment protein [Rhodothermia bacterium]|nr:MAG: EutN/CcmL family microcompartment protein [Rhodothermia bacterium]